MRAYQISDLSQPGDLRQVAPRRPAKGEVLLSVKACGLNFADLLLAKGQYQERPELPFTLGMEPAGEVLATGEGVALPKGARVMAFAPHGGLAEQAVVPASACTLIPDVMSYEEAAAFQVAYGTAHVALNHRAGLKRGETLLVLGAAGGVGLTAVEIGKLMGARVIACARGADKLAVCAAAGADHLIDSEADDLRAEVTALGGADVVYDPVGGAQFSAALRACKPEARMVVVGFASGEVPPIPANILLVKNISVLGYYWGGYLAFRPEILRESQAELLDWYMAGKLRPHISHTLPLDEARAAYALLSSRKSTGKVVVTVGT
ncbi:MAG TPA: NADPH:quinone oxidoreductase family protein [Aliiroseovarius sp.]|nr:NADPH:quinone oxidoreductase family protein [Aliiroseovarius sp.]